jgi:hypothetical protein
MTRAAIKAATAHTRVAVGHSISAESDGACGSGTEDGSEEKIGRGGDKTVPATAGAAASGIATRICGAPHCKQNGLPSATLCPHLLQAWSMEVQG